MKGWLYKVLSPFIERFIEEKFDNFVRIQEVLAKSTKADIKKAKIVIVGSVKDSKLTATRLDIQKSTLINTITIVKSANRKKKKVKTEKPLFV